MEKMNGSALVQTLPCTRRRKQLWPDRQTLECTRTKQKEKKAGGKTKEHHYVNGTQQ